MQPPTATILRFLLTFFLFSDFHISAAVQASPATYINITNNCPFTIWPGIIPVVGSSVILGGGLTLRKGKSRVVAFPRLWSGRIWARTGCSFSQSEHGGCATGDCGGALECRTDGGTPPATLLEITLGRTNFYDVSLVDGFNLGMSFIPENAACKTASCRSGINGVCPIGLRQLSRSGRVIGCKSACLAFGTPMYCCTGKYSSSTSCPSTAYSRFFKKQCPSAYSYAFDDKSSLFTCSSTRYKLNFC